MGCRLWMPREGEGDFHIVGEEVTLHQSEYGEHAVEPSPTKACCMRQTRQLEDRRSHREERRQWLFG